MPRTSLAERMSRLEQQKARLAEQEARIRADERKQRTKRLIESGSLVEKAGLFELDDDALYGALLSLTPGAKDQRQIADWSKSGAKAREGETATRKASAEPLTVTFPAPLPTVFSTRLRSAGLRWNKLLQHWEGMADHDAVTELAAEESGAVNRVRKNDQASEPAADQSLRS